jgi:hypothetical protein
MPATHDHADLLLRTYEIRREPQLRQSRDFMNKVEARSFEEYNKKYPMGSPGSQHWGKVFGYWDMVCALVDRGLIDKDLFDTCTVEHVFLFLKFRPIIEGYRKQWNFPQMLASLERVATGHPGFAEMEKWAVQSSQQAERKPAGKAEGRAKAKRAAAR